MGKRGPLPIPKAVRLMEGTYREDRHAEPLHIPAGLPNAPDWLSPQESALFAAIVEKLSRVPGLVTTLDSESIARYCADWIDWLHARATIDEEGSITQGKVGKYQHPAVGIRNKAHDRLMKFESRFGMTAGDRASIGRAVGQQAPSAVATRKRA
jgi:P27 family predicted phage terminase small subunit